METIFKGDTWFCQLSKVNDSITWKVDIIEEELEIDGNLYLNLKCATLGEKAISSEHNIVEVETKDYSGEVKKWPILNMNLDINPTINLNLNFSHETIFKLISGSGPVSITGEILVDNSPPEAEEDYIPKHRDSTGAVEPSEEDSEEDNAAAPEEESSEEEAKKIVLAKKKGGVTSQSSKKRKLVKSVKSKNGDDSLDEEEEYFKKPAKITKASKTEVKKSKKKN